MTPPADLLAKAIEGDRTSLDALGAWCLARAFDTAFILLGRVPNRDIIAEEIAGDASARALRHLPQFQPGTHFDAWLKAIVRNCVSDHYRLEEKGLPHTIYRRWVHDFFAAYRSELEMAIEEGPDEGPGGRLALLQRIAADLNQYSYHEFMQLAYSGPADRVLERVKEWLRAYVGLEVVSLYTVSTDGDWAEATVPSEDLTEIGFMQQELVAQVNAHLAFLRPLCRRLLRWYYLEELRVPEIARLEQLSERTTYRRIESCTSVFRSRLAGDSFFDDFATGAAVPAARDGKPALAGATTRRDERQPAEEAGAGTG
jgi:RNA polymerase sigma factor (sigma-70 family)